MAYRGLSHRHISEVDSIVVQEESLLHRHCRNFQIDNLCSRVREVLLFEVYRQQPFIVLTFG